MEQFVIAHPAMTLAIGTVGAFVIIKLSRYLILAVSRLIGQPYKELTRAIETLARTMESIQEEVKEIRKEFKADREMDRITVGRLLDRMQAQETKCSTTQRFCPHVNPALHFLESSPEDPSQ